MIPTDYLRQVPIKHWLPVSLEFDREKVITGYKTQRAWFDNGNRAIEILMMPFEADREKLLRGEEVEGFQWIDLPIVEG